MKIYLVKGPKAIYYARMLQPNDKWTMRSLRTSNETEAKVRLGELSYELKQKGWEVPKVTAAPVLRDLIPPYLAHIYRRKAASWSAKQRQYLTGSVDRLLRRGYKDKRHFPRQTGGVCKRQV
jgi:hypothetical protein